jgi:hypothetical protein
MYIVLLQGPFLFISRYMFEFFKEDQSSLLLNKKNRIMPSFFGRQLVQNPLFLFVGALLLMKKFALVLRKPSSEPAWETPNCPPNIKCMVPALFDTVL